MTEDNDNLTGHNYDGIEEYDNPLPMWWLTTFLITIIFGVLYWIHYEFGGAPNQLAELDRDMAAIKLLQQSEVVVESEDDYKPNENLALQGKAVYQAKCAACHGDQLQGIIGPNLVDEYWIHGQAKGTQIAEVIRKGVNDKGMPAWDSLMTTEEIKSAVVFILSSQGQTPPNPKPPQGEKIVGTQ